MTARWRGLVGLLCAASVALAGCSSAGTGASGADHHQAVSSAGPSELVNKPQSGFAGFGLQPAEPRPSFALTDTAGRPYRFGTATAGRPTLLFFGYTHCPDECPTTMADIASALRHVPAVAGRRTLVVFVTTDPKRDTGPVLGRWLAQYAKGSPARFVGLTGTRGQIDAAQAAAHVMIAADGGLTHSTTVLLYGPDDYAHVSFALSDTERDQMIHDLPMVAGMGSGG